MKKIILLLSIIFILSACENKYIATGRFLNGNEIYYYESNQENCATWESMTIYEDEHLTYNYINTCPTFKVVKVEEEYISITSFLDNNEVSKEDILSSGLGYVDYYDSITTYLNIDFSNFTYSKTTVRLYEGELIEVNYTDELRDLEIDNLLIDNDLANIINQPLGTKSVCEDLFCRVVGVTIPITIEYTYNDEIIFFGINENYINVTYINGDYEAIIYYIEDIDGEIDKIFDIINNEL